jgi:hypothetical protein
MSNITSAKVTYCLYNTLQIEIEPLLFILNVGFIQIHVISTSVFILIPDTASIT